MTDDLSSVLEPIRLRLRTFGATFADESALLAALDEVLKLADRWTDEGNEFEWAAGELRAAIRRALTREETRGVSDAC